MKTTLSVILSLLLSTTLLAKDIDYIANGMPASDRRWAGADYQAVAQTLKSGTLALPSLADPNSAKFFKRLTNEDNLVLSRDKSLALPNRMDNFILMGQWSTAVTKMYLKHLNTDLSIHSDVAQLLSFNLKVSEVGTELVREYIPLIPKDDKYEVRLAGIKQMCGGVTQLTAGTILSLSEEDVYSKADLSNILDTLALTVPSLNWCFSSEYRRELSVVLKKHSDKLAQSDAGRKKIDQMLVLLSKESNKG